MNTRNYQRLADSPLFLFLIYSLISFFIHVFVIQSFVETSFSRVVVYICHYLRARRRNSIKSYMCKPRPCHLFRAIRKSQETVQVQPAGVHENSLKSSSTVDKSSSCWEEREFNVELCHNGELAEEAGIGGLVRERGQKLQVRGEKRSRAQWGSQFALNRVWLIAQAWGKVPGAQLKWTA